MFNKSTMRRVLTFAMAAVMILILPKHVFGQPEAHNIHVFSSNISRGSAFANHLMAFEGENVTITASSNEGYVFSHWVVNSGNVSPANINASPTSFSMPSGNVEIMAIFEPALSAPHSITVTANNSSLGTAWSSPASAREGERVDLTANSHSGHTFLRWEGDIMINNASSPSASFFMPNRPVTVTAVFSQPRRATVEINDPNLGWATVNNQTEQEVSPGTIMNLQASPSLPNVFERWEVVAGNVSINSPTSPVASFTMPDSNVTIRAVFSNFGTITVSSNNSAWGNASSLPNIAARGGTVNLSASPASNNTFVRWEVIAGNITISNPSSPNTTFTVPNNHNGNIYIRAVFAQAASLAVTLEVNNTSWGSAGSNPASPVAGSTVNLNAQPTNTGNFVRWEVISGSAAINNPNSPNASFIMPSGNVHIRAVFAQAARSNISVSTPEELLSAVTNNTANPINITLLNDITVSAWHLNQNTNVNLLGSGRIIGSVVVNNGSLTINGPTIVSTAATQGFWVMSGARAALQQGTIQSRHFANNGTFVMNSGSIAGLEPSPGQSPAFFNQGNFTQTGGSINNFVLTDTGSMTRNGGTANFITAAGTEVMPIDTALLPPRIVLPTSSPSLAHLSGRIQHDPSNAARVITNTITISGSIIAVDGHIFPYDAEHFGSAHINRSGVSVLPARLILAVLLGANPYDDNLFRWDASTQSFFIDPYGHNISFTVGSDVMFISGEPRTILSGEGAAAFPYAPYIDPSNSRMFVPLRAVAEAVGYEVQWDGRTNTVTLVPPSLSFEMQDGPLWANEGTFRNNGQVSGGQNTGLEGRIRQYLNQYAASKPIANIRTNNELSNHNDRNPVPRSQSDRIASFISYGWREDSLSNVMPFSQEFFDFIISEIDFHFIRYTFGGGGYFWDLFPRPRIAVRVNEDFISNSTFTAIHELGHALGLGETLADLLAEEFMGLQHSSRGPNSHTYNFSRGHARMQGSGGFAYNSTFDRSLLRLMESKGQATEFWAAAFHSNAEYGRFWNRHMGHLISFNDLQLTKGVLHATEAAGINRHRPYLVSDLQQKLGMTPAQAGQQLLADWRIMLGESHPDNAHSGSPSAAAVQQAAQRFNNMIDSMRDFAEIHNVLPDVAVLDYAIWSHNFRFYRNVLGY